jgi:uncharacterized membrane protein (UPF0127 family)
VKSFKCQKRKNIKLKNKAKQNSFLSKRNLIIIIVLAAFIVTAYFLFIKKSGEPEWVKEGEVTFLNKDTKQVLSKIEVEAAINHTERTQGLMYRSEMDEDKGMIFLFEDMDMRSFWMKNTLIPLDIIFIDNKGVINTIHRNTVPYSEKSLPSKQKSQFVVEVNGGYCSRHGIREGDLIEYKLDTK